MDDTSSVLRDRLGRANALLAQGRLAEMLDLLEPLTLVCGNNAEFQCLRGITLLTLDEPEQGEAALRRAVELEPRLLKARVYHAAALADLGRSDDALREYDEALALAPHHVEARAHRALLWLSKGDFARGWTEYEWRLQLSPNLCGGPLPFTPRWQGEPFPGRTLLLLAEQGFGDTLQFARFAAAAQARGGRVILECQPELARLLQGMPGLDEVVPRGPAPPPHDLHLPLLSLPRFFCPGPEAIPPPVPFPAVPPAAPRGKGPRRIGLVWAGGRGNTRDRSRSCPPEALAALRAVPDVEWVRLQQGEGATPWLPFAEDADRCADFLETARLVAGLDLVVSVDTAVAHLAGSLGKPLALLLPEPACWRWMADRERTPWYPSARLFRQARHGDWPELVSRVARAIETGYI